MLEILRRASLRLKKSKCNFLSDTVEYLGFKVDATSKHATEERVRAVQNAPVAKTVSEVYAFMGLVTMDRI